MRSFSGLFRGHPCDNSASSLPQQGLPAKHPILGWNTRCCCLSGNKLFYSFKFLIVLFPGWVQAWVYRPVLSSSRVQHNDVKPFRNESRFIKSRDEAVAKWIFTGRKTWTWLLLEALFQGTGCEMYTETLSTSFIGMTFSEAAETCFVKVKPQSL